MRRFAVVVAAVAAVVAVALAGCGGGGDDDGPSDQLADRVAGALRSDPDAVIDRLGELGVEIDAVDVEGGDLTCPNVREPEPGDGATCTTDVEGQPIAVEVEFGEGDDLSVVLIELQP